MHGSCYLFFSSFFLICFFSKVVAIVEDKLFHYYPHCSYCSYLAVAEAIAIVLFSLCTLYKQRLQKVWPLPLTDIQALALLFFWQYQSLILVSTVYLILTVSFVCECFTLVPPNVCICKCDH